MIDLHCQSRKTADLFPQVLASDSLIPSQLPIVIGRPVFLAFNSEKLAKLLTSNLLSVREHIVCLVKKFDQNL